MGRRRPAQRRVECTEHGFSNGASSGRGSKCGSGSGGRRWWEVPGQLGKEPGLGEIDRGPEWTHHFARPASRGPSGALGRITLITSLPGRRRGLRRCLWGPTALDLADVDPHPPSRATLGRAPPRRAMPLLTANEAHPDAQGWAGLRVRIGRQTTHEPLGRPLRSRPARTVGSMISASGPADLAAIYGRRRQQPRDEERDERRGGKKQLCSS